MSLWLGDIKSEIIITGPDGKRNLLEKKSNYYKTVDSVGKLLVPKIKKSNLLNYILANKNCSDKAYRLVKN
jgi:hypothetical protein